MAEQRVVNSTLNIFEFSKGTTLDYPLDVFRINSTEAFLTLNEESFQTAHIFVWTVE